MATFEAQIEGLTSLSIDGSSAPTQNELTQFLTDGAKEIINIMPSNLLPLCASQATFTSVAVGSEAETLNTAKILNVFRNDGDIDQPCRVIDAIIKGRVSDPYEMQYATITDPVYYIENNKINVLPDGGSCKYSEVQYPSVAYGESAISVFPDEAEYLVPLYAAIKSLQNVLGDKSSNSDITTALTAVNAELDETLTICDEIGTQVDAAIVQAAESATQVDSGVDTALAAIATAAGRINTAVALANDEFDEIATQVSGSVTSAIASARAAVPGIIAVSDLSIGATAPVAPASPSFNAGAISVSSSPPTYIKPTFSAPSLGSVGSLTLPVVPAVPSLTSVTFASIDSALNAGAPVYTTATIGASSTYTGSAPTFTKPTPVPDFGNVNTYIDTNEDIELAQVKIQEVNAQLSEYSTNIQNEQAEFNKENVLYQSAIQESVQEVQIANQVNIARAQSDLQIATTNKDRDQQRQLQNGINDMQAIINDNNRKTSLYQAEVQTYQAEVNAKVQEWVNEEWNQNFQKYQQDYGSKLQEYGSNIQNELNEFNKGQTVFQNELQEKIQEANNQQTKDSSEYSAKLQKYSNELQSYQAQVNDVVQEYQVTLQSRKEEFDSSIALQASYYQESQAGINAGNAYLAEANASAQEAQTYVNEVNARIAQVGGYGQVINSYINAAQGYANEIQSKIAVAQAYGNEIQARLSVDTAHYGWYEKQQAKLQQDYDKGLQFLTGGGQPRGER